MKLLSVWHGLFMKISKKETFFSFLTKTVVNLQQGNNNCSSLSLSLSEKFPLLSNNSKQDH